MLAIDLFLQKTSVRVPTTKDAGRSPNDERNPNSEARNRKQPPADDPSSFGLGASFVIRALSFVIPGTGRGCGRRGGRNPRGARSPKAPIAAAAKGYCPREPAAGRALRGLH